MAPDLPMGVNLLINVYTCTHTIVSDQMSLTEACLKNTLKIVITHEPLEGISLLSTVMVNLHLNMVTLTRVLQKQFLPLEDDAGCLPQWVGGWVDTLRL